MMRPIVLAMLIGIVCFTTSVSAINPYQSLRGSVIHVGKTLDNVENVPLIGKLTNLLPVAMVAASLQKCPGQAMFIMIGLCAYALSYNETIRSFLSQYDLINTSSTDNHVNDAEIDESFFVFDEKNSEHEVVENNL